VFIGLLFKTSPSGDVFFAVHGVVVGVPHQQRLFSVLKKNNRMRNNLLITLFCSLVLASCSKKNEFNHDDGLQSMTRESLEGYIKTLSSDEFMGRRPFTAGETKTIQYLEEQFRALGLEPGNGDSYLQDVPMVEITAIPDDQMEVTGKKDKFSLKGFDDYTLNTERTDSSIVWKNEEVVFAGFGVVAPEYNWNDYEGLDVKGKIVLVLVNDPGFGGDDTTFFKGNTMTYYGRWTYKYEEAARQGAKGCFVIHNTVPAGYPFAVLQNGWKSPHLYLQSGKDKSYCQGIGWITKPATEKLLTAAGYDFNEQQTKARQRGFKGFPLNLKVSTAVKVKARNDHSHNVIATLRGSGKPDEYIIYTAHWDHLGVGKKDAQGDSIYNGAYDNASGTAALLELAKAFKQLENKPKRSIVFLAVTAEEQGLWGSAYYAGNPVYPRDKTVANINIDGVNPYGKMKDVMIVGVGQSELEDILKEEAKLLDRDVYPDNESEKGSYFRSDHFNFAKVGIPALYIKTGTDFAGKGKEYGQQQKDNYTQKHYHQPSDEFDPSRVNYEGAIDDLNLLFQVGKRLAFSDVWPQWKEGSEFKNARKE
jgi:Zn-dependent M28 family amino/carboxypeptidase